MSKNITAIPYTELQERVSSLSRVSENTKEKVRGVIQDVYTREIALKFDWDFLIASSSLITIAEHKLGTVSVNTGDTALTFSSDAALTAAMTGRKIKLSGNDVVYTFTRTATTSGTISPDFNGSSNATSVSYSIFQPVYPLSSDFDRFPSTVDDDSRGGGLYRWQGGQKIGIPLEDYIESVENYTSAPSIPSRIKMVGANTLGVQQIEFRPAPRDARVYNYDYIKELKPLKETSAGTVSITANATGVTGNTACRFTEATTGDYLRIDAFGVGQDSTWHRIVAIANDSSCTLQSAFANSGVVSTNYVISSAPEMPSKLHPAILYGSIRALTLDQTDENFLVYHMRFAEVLTDAKRIHVTRVYSKKVTGDHEDYQYRR